MLNLTSTNDFEEIISRVQTLDEIYDRQNARLSTKVLEHPGYYLKITGLSRKPKILWYYMQIEEILPAWLAVEVDERARKIKLSSLEKEALSERILRFRNPDQRSLNNVTNVLKCHLSRIRVYLCQPKEPKFSPERPRGYKDHGSMREFASVIRSTSNALGSQEMEIFDKFYDARANDYLRASRILEMEARGISTEEIQRRPEAFQPTEESLVDPCFHPSNILSKVQQSLESITPGEGGKPLSDIDHWRQDRAKTIIKKMNLD